MYECHTQICTCTRGQLCMQPRNSSNNSNIMWSCAAATASHMHYFFNATVKNFGNKILGTFLYFWIFIPRSRYPHSIENETILYFHSPFCKQLLLLLLLLLVFCCTQDILLHYGSHQPYTIHTQLEKETERKNNLSLTKTSGERKRQKKWRSEIFIHNKDPFLLQQLHNSDAVSSTQLPFSCDFLFLIHEYIHSTYAYGFMA